MPVLGLAIKSLEASTFTLLEASCHVKKLRLDERLCIERGVMEANQDPSHVSEAILDITAPAKLTAELSHASDPRRDHMKPTHRILRNNKSLLF